MKTEGQLTADFKANKGLRPGREMGCPWLSSICAGSTEVTNKSKRYHTRSNGPMCHMHYDMVQIAWTEKDLKETFVVLEREAKEVGLEIKKKKTKYLPVMHSSDVRPQGNHVN